ncbi:MAG: hypothetical protein JO165_01105 [Candidatus Eremiobacteraeota bacterium]|nr:hypothetical protein [Candidatus Eremiobacteraeota bacterium]
MPNDDATVEEYRLLRFDASLSDGDAARIGRAIETMGAEIRFGAPESDRTYALLRSREEIDVPQLQASSGAVILEGTVIALAIEPLQPDALPLLDRALREPAGLAGMRSFECIGNEAIVELDTAVTPVNRLFTVVDVELARFGTPLRRTRVLTPLSPNVLAAIAAAGLECPEIAPDRILESLLERPT